MFAVGGIGQASTDVLTLQFRIVLQDLCFGHTRSEPALYIVDGDTHVAHARLPAALARLNRDSVAIISHGGLPVTTVFVDEV